MLSRKNNHELQRKMEDKQDRFTLRKLSIGVASILLGSFLMGIQAAQPVLASTEVANPSSAVMSKDDGGVNKLAQNTVGGVTPQSLTTTSSVQSSGATDGDTDRSSSQTTATNTLNTSGSQATVLPSQALQASLAKDGIEYHVKIRLVDVTTGKVPDLSNSGVYNYYFKNGVFEKDGLKGTRIIEVAFGIAPTGYKLLNSDDLDKYFTHDTNKNCANFFDIKGNADVTLRYAPLSPILVQYIDENSKEVLASSLVGANTSSSASYAYLHGDHSMTGPSRFLLHAIDIPGYQLDDQSTFIDEYQNVQSKGNPNFQVHQFKYKKIMDNSNPKGVGSEHAKYGEIFGPDWDAIDPNDILHEKA